MSDFNISDTDERVFLLNNLELLTAIFRGPDSEGWTAIISTGLPELMARSTHGGADLTHSLNNLQEALPTSSKIPDGLSDLETEYVRLFVAGRGGIVAPLYESCHLGDAPRIMGDAALSMQSRLNECGLEVSLESNEPPDHLSLELEYIYHLLVTGWSDNKPELENKAQEFAKLEMLPWLRRFRDALNNGEPHPAYSTSADLAIDVLKMISGKR